MRTSFLRCLAALLFVSACAPGEPLVGQESWKTDFAETTVDLDEIVSGGPPKDGIPAIDEPHFVDIASANRFLDDDEPVAVVRRGGEVKAYPLQILIWHEIVNDMVGGEPVTVTYCPLCNTTLAFDRRFEGEILDFGTTGRLRFSDLIMYDRQSETWWQQATGEAIVGEHAGKSLTFIPAPVMSWRDVMDQLPDARVLSRNTGFPGYRERYGVNPYLGYDSQAGPMPWTFDRDVPAGLPPMERVAALRENGVSWAVPFSELKKRPVAHVDMGELAVVVFYTPETVSSVDAERIPDSRAVGSSAAYQRSVDGRTLTFAPAEQDGTYRDRETGSLWNFSGRSTEGELAGTQLEEVPHGNHFWFAWAVFRPDTEIWRG